MVRSIPAPSRDADDEVNNQVLATGPILLMMADLLPDAAEKDDKEFVCMSNARIDVLMR